MIEKTQCTKCRGEYSSCDCIKVIDDCSEQITKEHYFYIVIFQKLSCFFICLKIFFNLSQKIHEIYRNALYTDFLFTEVWYLATKIKIVGKN